MERIIIGILIVLLLGAGVYAFVSREDTDMPPQTANITSYEECVAAGYSITDSYPEQCETPEGERFSAFDVPNDWETYSDAGGVMFRYPEMAELDYLDLSDWPPQVQVLDEALTCTSAGDVSEDTGRTEERSIDGRTYCVTTIVEGAAGSTYTQYAYATEIEDQTAILTFSTRMPQCANFGGGSEQDACEQEEADFEPDTTIGRIVETLRLGTNTAQ